jgi:hypothetical protein
MSSFPVVEFKERPNFVNGVKLCNLMQTVIALRPSRKVKVKLSLDLSTMP